MTFKQEVNSFASQYSEDQVIASKHAQGLFKSLLKKAGIEQGKLCPGCIRGKYRHLIAISNKNIMSETKKGKRYWLPEGKQVRPFGGDRFYDNSTITDEMIEKFDKQTPGFKNAFIDSWETEEQEEKIASVKSERWNELNKDKKAILVDLYEELSGEQLKKNVTKDEVIDMIIAEEKAMGDFDNDNDSGDDEPETE